MLDKLILVHKLETRSKIIVSPSQIFFFSIPQSILDAKWWEDCQLKSTLKEGGTNLKRLNTNDTPTTYHLKHTSLNRSESFAVRVTRSTRNNQGTSQSSLIRSDTNGDLSKTDLSFKNTIQYIIVSSISLLGKQYTPCTGHQVQCKKKKKMENSAENLAK